MQTSEPKIRELPAQAAPDPSWRDLYLAGAVSAAICVGLYVAALVVSIAAPAAPATGGAATLHYIAAHRTLYIIEQVLWEAPSLFAMVVFLALCVALWKLNKSYAAIAGLVGVTSWALSLAWPTTGGGAPALVYLSDQYAAAASSTQRGSFASAAEALIAQNNIPIAIGILQTIGILLIALLMLKGVFHKGVAYLGIATGAIGVVSESLRPVLGGFYAIYGLLLFAWFVAIAWELYRLSSKASRGLSVGELIRVDGNGKADRRRETTGAAGQR